MERWLEGSLKQSVSPRTYGGYAWQTRKHVVPGLDHIKLKELTAEHLDALYVQKSNSGLGPCAVGYIHSTIRVALQRAVKKRLIPYNVARDADPSKQTKREYTTLSQNQLTSFFRAAAEAKDCLEAFFIVAALAGPRPGELLALKWADLRLPEEPNAPGEARIRRSLSTTREGLVLRETTKTGKGRLVYLLPPVE